MAGAHAANLFITLVFTQSLTPLLTQDISEDVHLNFTGLATKYGFPCDEHEVVTEDGYVIKLFHIPGDKTRPVLLMHGVIDSADSFILRGNSSMAADLANAGYDVWLGNKRGNRYSRKHVKLDPNNDKGFWDFSFHEIAIYDLPASIDYILNQTGQEKLSCIGHSQGNTVFYVMGSMRPEYNDKITLMIALAPIAYLYHLPNPSKYVVESWPLINNLLASIGQEEVFSDNSMESNMWRTLCSGRDRYQFCGNGIIFALAGYDPDELESEFLPMMSMHYPSGTSRKTGTHLLQQGLKKSFSQMDYGVNGNLAAYNSTVPPDYDLSKVTMKVALLAAANDKMCSLTDVKILRHKLPNVVEYHVMDWRKFNHVDYVWGRNSDKNLHPKILSLLEKFGTS